MFMVWTIYSFPRFSIIEEKKEVRRSIIIRSDPNISLEQTVLRDKEIVSMASWLFKNILKNFSNFFYSRYSDLNFFCS